MTNYRVVKETGEWLVLMLCTDGIEDVLAACGTRSDAERILQEIIQERAATDSAERRYQNQYAHACGYHD